MMELPYKKQAGTSGISGQLYETKLSSLIAFRLLHDKSIEEFSMASNIDDIGNFDDICLKMKIVGRERPILAFIQTKHKESEEKMWKYELIKELSTSFIKVRQMFLNNITFFNGKFEDTDCLFILYTNAKDSNDSNYIKSIQEASHSKPTFKHALKPYESNFSDKLKNLLLTSDSDFQCYQADYTDEDLKFANQMIMAEEINFLAEHFVKFLDVKISMNIMQDFVIQRYHVILAESVVNISAIISAENQNPQCRHLKFRYSFFDTDNEVLTMLRNKIFQQIFKTQIKKNKKEKATEDEKSAVDKQIKLFLYAPSALTLSDVIGTQVIYKHGSLEFSTDRPQDLETLKKINISPLTVNEAEAIAARNILLSLKLKVPDTFGNVDLKISGNHKKVEKRINFLSDFITNLCKQSEFIHPYNIVTIDNNVGVGFLNLNGGIGSAIGNLLVHDDFTKLLKVTEHSALLQSNARHLLDKLNSKIKNLYSYRFDARAIVTFPKLIFDYTNEAKTIFNLTVIYNKESNNSGIKTLLKQEIEQHHRTHYLAGKSDSMIIHYQNEIQKRFSKTHLTKSDNDKIYQQAINNIKTEPQIIAMQTTFNMNNKKYFGYRFIKTIEITSSRTIIETDIFALTTLRVTQFWKTNNYVVLSLEWLLNLSVEDYAAFIYEVSTTKHLIIVCNITKHSRILHKRLNELARAIEDKEIVVVTKKEFSEIVQEYFLTTKVINDEGLSLNDLQPQTQMRIMKNTKVTFQGEEKCLNLIIDDVSATFIRGAILDKVINDETITIGKPLSNIKYEEIKHMYVERRIQRDEDKHIVMVTSLYNISDNTVLLTAKPGMGKTTLLTHLAVATKYLHSTVWIFKINFLEQSQALYDWIVSKIVVDIMDALQFVCHVIVDNINLSISLKEMNNKVYLEDCTGDEWATFELNMFLHFYNEKKVIYVFDGFDEICPFYKHKTLKLLRIIMNDPRNHKMWVSSRPHVEILPDLQKLLGKPYELVAPTAEEEKRMFNILNESPKCESLENRTRQFYESNKDS